MGLRDHRRTAAVGAATDLTPDDDHPAVLLLAAIILNSPALRPQVSRAVRRVPEIVKQMSQTERDAIEPARMWDGECSPEPPLVAMLASAPRRTPRSALLDPNARLARCKRLETTHVIAISRSGLAKRRRTRLLG